MGTTICLPDARKLLTDTDDGTVSLGAAEPTLTLGSAPMRSREATACGCLASHAWCSAVMPVDASRRCAR